MYAMSKKEYHLVHAYLEEGDVIPYPHNAPYHVQADRSGTNLHVWWMMEKKD